MRIKVGNNWYDASNHQPIMVELTPKDKENIANMSPEATKYAELPDTWSKEQCYEWMEAVKPQERDIDPEFP